MVAFSSYTLSCPFSELIPSAPPWGPHPSSLICPLAFLSPQPFLSSYFFLSDQLSSSGAHLKNSEKSPGQVLSG